MSLIDKFLNAIKLNDDEYDEEEFLDDDFDDIDEEYEDKKVTSRYFGFANKNKNTADVDDDFDIDIDDDEIAPKKTEAKPKTKAVAPVRKERAPKKSKPISRKRSSSQGSMEVSVIKPTSMEDAREITDTLLDDCTVILNLEGIDVDLAQRIIDFTCGSCYSLDGSLQMISSYIFILTPANVDITGDYQSILSDALDIPAMRTRY